MSKQHKKYTIIEILAISMAGFGLILFICFGLNIWTNLKLVDKAQFGDLVGGVIGTIWSFAGILLFYSALRLQKNEFALQRDEFALQREEFTLNRITNIIYKQKEVIERSKHNENIYFERVDKRGILALNHIVEEIKTFDNDTEYKLLIDSKKSIVEFGRKFVYQPAMEDLIYSLYSSLKLITDYIEDKYEGENRNGEFVLRESDQTHLYRLASSIWNFDEINKLLFAMKTYVFFWEQEKVFGAPIYDKWSRINKMLDYSLENIMRIKRKKLREVDSFYRREANVSENGVQRKMYCG